MMMGDAKEALSSRFSAIRCHSEPRRVARPPPSTDHRKALEISL